MNIHPVFADLQATNRELESTLAMCGGHVLRLVLPLELAPTMNVYSSMKGWQRAKLREALDHEVAKAKSRDQLWQMGVVRTPIPGPPRKKMVHGRAVMVPSYRTKVTGGRKRFVVVTRESSRRPDEVSCDAVGAKPGIDRLVIGCVLRGDSAKWLLRHARWLPAKPGAGKLIVDVFELGGT